MIKAPHWQLKSHLKYIRTDGPKKSYDARFPVLMYLIMASNNQLRCYVGISTLCKDTGLSNKPVGEALQWLESHGAIVNVPPEYRRGKEKTLHANKKVWQLTGKLQAEDQVIDYLYTGDSVQLNQIISDITYAPDHINRLLSQSIDVHNTSNSTEIGVQDTSDLQEVDVQSTCKSEQISVQSTSISPKIHVQSTREVINNTTEVINKEKKVINKVSHDVRVEETILPEKNLEAEANEQSVTEPVTAPESPINFDDKPYTEDEYNYFVTSGRVPAETLEWSVYNPIEYDDDNDICNPYWDDRRTYLNFAQRQKQLSDWQKMVGIVSEFFCLTHQRATKLASQLRGTAKKGKHLEHNIEPGMDVVELFAFGYWIAEAKCREPKYRPQSAETVAEYVDEFRSLPNHFAHINYARYKIMEFFAEPQPAFVPDPDDERFHTAPTDELDKLYAEAEALLGFSLSGEY